MAFLALIGCGFVGVGWPRSVEPWLAIAGAVLAVLGLVLFGFGTATLGRALTPLPKPRADSTLREDGVYRFVRHPVYGGLTLFALGWSLVRSPVAFAPAAALAAIFVLKALREEAWLAERFPAYPGYRARVRRRFVPWLL